MPCTRLFSAYRVLPAVLLLAVLVLATACAEPPSKEMHQAQGAIDAARAAGAEQYAADELNAAITWLAQADEAVTANDYRLALANALNSREQAQAAAKAAVDARARARGNAERLLAEAVAVIERAQAHLATPAVARLPRRTLAPAEAAIASATSTLQEARTALEHESYGIVVSTAERVSDDVEAALEALEAAARPAPASRRR